MLIQVCGMSKDNTMFTLNKALDTYFMFNLPIWSNGSIVPKRYVLWSRIKNVVDYLIVAPRGKHAQVAIMITALLNHLLH